MLAATLIDLRQLDEAEDVVRAADTPALRGIPAQAALSILRARIHLTRGLVADAADAGQSALAAAEALESVRVRGHRALRAGRDRTAPRRRRGRGSARGRGLARSPQFADLYARAETALAQAQISEVRDGPAGVLGHLRRACPELQARRGLLLGDPAAAPWLARTALAAGEDELAAVVAGAAEALAAGNPGYPAVTAAAAHSLGLAGRDPGRLAEAAAQQPDPWAQASAAEDLGVLHARQADREQAIDHLTRAIHGYQQTGAAADRPGSGPGSASSACGAGTDPAGVRLVSGWREPERRRTHRVGTGRAELNNREVACRMYVSANTVAFDMRQTFRKLSIGSRVELTRIVLEQSPAAPR